MSTPINTPPGPGSDQPRVIGGEDNPNGPGPYLMTTSSLESNEVYNLEGEELGKIKDIMIDVPKGKVAYAVLSFGGVLGMGNKLFAIPWNALTLDADENCFVLRVNKEVLENDPGFDKDNWPSMADQRWASDVHNRYETRPYWESRTP